MLRNVADSIPLIGVHYCFPFSGSHRTPPEIASNIHDRNYYLVYNSFILERSKKLHMEL
jgi:hypothetical protein